MPDTNPQLFINRELSWLEFNQRVLDEARDEIHPLLERFKFLGITSSNLDEFFEIRVAGLKQQAEAEGDFRTFDGLSPRQQLALIAKRTHKLVDEQNQVWSKLLIPALREAGVNFVGLNHLKKSEEEWIAAHFRDRLAPLLTPLALDPSHPFPLLLNKSLNLALALHDRHPATEDEVERLGLVQVPRSLPRLVQLPSPGKNEARYIFLADLMRLHVGSLFPGQDCTGIWPFRVTRNSNLYLDEDEAENLLVAIEDELRKRRRGQAVRLEIEKGVDSAVLHYLSASLHLAPEDVYPVEGPVNMQRFLAAYQEIPRPDLKDPAFTPVVPEILRDAGAGMFDIIKQNDILLHHPYESFGPVVDFLAAAAVDPQVRAIKQTLYRTTGDSPIVSALIQAANLGKQVTVLMELKARFEEEVNIHLARELEEAGVHVVYGIMGLKTHAKLMLVVREEPEGLVRYAHLGTGNYNPFTARVYTDLGLFTCRPELGRDVAAVFNMLTAFSANAGAPPMEKLMLAPSDLSKRIIEKITRETANARAGRPARVIAKMNALVDYETINALYDAGAAGVKVELIVRGICCLRPGAKGLSENIRVRSILDHFLEHSRIYYFENNGDPEIWLGSADWMPRNFERRVEVLFPVDQPVMKARVINEILAACLADNVKVSWMQADGTYCREKPPEKSAAFRCQQALMDLAQGKPVAIPPLPGL